MKSGTVGANRCSFLSRFWRTLESLSWLGSLMAITVGGSDSALNECSMPDILRGFSGVLLSSFKSKISSQMRLSSLAVMGLHVDNAAAGMGLDIIIVFVIITDAICTTTVLFKCLLSHVTILKSCVCYSMFVSIEKMPSVVFDTHTSVRVTGLWSSVDCALRSYMSFFFFDTPARMGLSGAAVCSLSYAALSRLPHCTTTRMEGKNPGGVYMVSSVSAHMISVLKQEQFSCSTTL